MTNVKHGRFALFRSPTIPGSGPTGINSGSDLGTYQVGRFSRFTGMWSGISSATIRYRMGVHSGDYHVSSSFVVNSGPSVFDALNYGLYVNFQVTAALSQAPRLVIIGEPIR
jgi:hypothetical protein